MAGCQLILQPDFKKSDKKFRREETISSAGIATDRSGNERVAKYSIWNYGLFYERIKMNL